MLDEIIKIKDSDLARVIREQLEKSGKRDNRFKTLIYNDTFSKEELESITALKIKDGRFKDISELLSKKRVVTCHRFIKKQPL